jgi:8-oxo-dGTP pyrophosphatase MutT (NUDIX family)
MIFLQNSSELIRQQLPDLLENVPSSVTYALDDAGNFRGDHDLNPASVPPKNMKFKPASVLVPLVMRDEGLNVLLTRRAGHLKKHAGQISFPGGKFEEADGSMVETALRESEEEIGLDPSVVDIAGALNIYITVTGYAVTPIVGFVEPMDNLIADAGEVAEIFEVPLTFLMDARNHKRHSGFLNGVERFWYAMPYEEYYIWGATAGMLRDLHDRAVAK